MELKLSDIVRRGQLDKWTAQYVLKHPEYLPDMPEAGSQGMHRVFSLEQAIRLAIVTSLVETGVPLKDAPAILQFCEEREQKMWPHRERQPPFEEIGRRTPWKLRLIDKVYVQLIHGSKSERWFSLEAQQWTERSPYAIKLVELNLSALVSRLQSTNL